MKSMSGNYRKKQDKYRKKQDKLDYQALRLACIVSASMLLIDGKCLVTMCSGDRSAELKWGHLL